MTAVRIALVAPFGLRAKGTTRARALPLGRALAGRGHAVALFVPPYDCPEDSGRQWREAAAPRADLLQHERGRRDQAPGVDVINIALPARGRGGAAWHLWLGARLFLAARGWQPDVIHVFKPKGPSGLAGTLAWVARHRPWPHGRDAGLVIDADDWEGPGGWNDDPRTGYSTAQRRFFAWQERYGLVHADAWTVASQCLRQRAVSFGAAPAHVHLLHNGMEAPGAGERTAHIERFTANLSHPTALLYTRFAGVRPADVAALWAEVRARLPGARLVVAGQGVAGEERELAGVPGIDVRGWVAPAELPALLRDATLAIAPWADTLSNRARHSAKVLELMAGGLPVVAYAVGELPATLGETGVLAPPGDRAALAGAVAALLADPARAGALGADARARVQARFTWGTLAEVALAAYGAAAQAQARGEPQRGPS